MKPSVKPAARDPVERLPAMPWNECPRSRGIDAHLPWNAQAVTVEDEVITAKCDLDMGRIYKETIFNFALHRRPEHYT